MEAADTFRNVMAGDNLNTPSMRSVRGVSGAYIRKPLTVSVLANVLRDRNAASHANVKCVENEGNLLENNLNFVNDTPTVCVFPL
jgi:hypothetical protein